ncbi:hypothetical protein ABTD62_22485, partial [Acinetobacter baumannii]
MPRAWRRDCSRAGLCYASTMEPAESVLFFFGWFALVAEAMTAALAAGRMLIGVGVSVCLGAAI